MMIHIFTEGHQPATRWTDPHMVHGKRKHWIKIKPQACRFTMCCKKRRWVKYLTVQVYYDSIMYWCREGTGCKKK